MRVVSFVHDPLTYGKMQTLNQFWENVPKLIVIKTGGAINP